MTLVGLFTIDGLPVMIGDALVTTSDELTHAINIPAAENVNAVLPRAPAAYICALRQKINILGKRLVVGFAGDEAKIRDIADTLHFVANLNGLNYDLINQIVTSMEPDRLKGVQAVGLILDESKQGMQGHSIFGINVQPPAPLGMFENATVAGSGSTFFTGLLREFDLSRSSTLDLIDRAKMVASQIAISLVGHEFTTGESLLESWGGAIEILFHGQGGFRKLGDILYLFWEVKHQIADGRFGLHLTPKLVKIDYKDGILLVRTIEFALFKNGKGRIQRDRVYIVPPITMKHQAMDIDLSALPAPKLSCTSLFNYILVPERDNSFRCLTRVRYQGAGIDDIEIVEERGYLSIHVRRALLRKLREQIATDGGITI